MKKIAVILSIAAIIGSLHAAPAEGELHPPAPEWVVSDDPALDEIVKKTLSEPPARVKWLLQSPADADTPAPAPAPAPGERREGAEVVTTGEPLAARIRGASYGIFFLVPDDEKRTGPEDPRHWKSWGDDYPACVVVEPPDDPTIAKFPDLAKRIYDVPIFLVGDIDGGNVVDIVDALWREVVKGLALGMSPSAAPLWQSVDQIELGLEGATVKVTVHLTPGGDESAEGFDYPFQKTSGGWEPAVKDFAD